MSRSLDREAVALRGHVQRLLRRFGVLAEGRTPCGTALSISAAHALMVVGEANGEARSPTMSELARVLGIDKSNVTRLCRRLERDGCLEAIRPPDDGRVRRLRLTRKGKRMASDVEASSRKRFERIARALERHERTGLIASLEALERAISETIEEES